MANITDAGTSDYPSSLDTRRILTGGPSGDTISVTHPNGVMAAVVNIENNLGVNPQGTTGSLVVRLNVITQSDGSLKNSFAATGFAKGDILVADGAGNLTHQAIGADGTFLQALSSQALGVQWVASTTIGLMRALDLGYPVML